MTSDTRRMWPTEKPVLNRSYNRKRVCSDGVILLLEFLQNTLRVLNLLPKTSRSKASERIKKRKLNRTDSKQGKKISLGGKKT